MSKDQIRKAFEATIGMPPRVADIAVVEMLGGTPEVVAEYIWDHWLGEPESPSVEEVQQRMMEAIQ